MKRLMPSVRRTRFERRPQALYEFATASSVRPGGSGPSGTKGAYGATGGSGAVSDAGSWNSVVIRARGPKARLGSVLTSDEDERPFFQRARQRTQAGAVRASAWRSEAQDQHIVGDNGPHGGTAAWTSCPAAKLPSESRVHAQRGANPWSVYSEPQPVHDVPFSQRIQGRSPRETINLASTPESTFVENPNLTLRGPRTVSMSRSGKRGTGRRSQRPVASDSTTYRLHTVCPRGFRRTRPSARSRTRSRASGDESPANWIRPSWTSRRTPRSEAFCAIELSPRSPDLPPWTAACHRTAFPPTLFDEFEPFLGSGKPNVGWANRDERQRVLKFTVEERDGPRHKRLFASELGIEARSLRTGRLV